MIKCRKAGPVNSEQIKIHVTFINCLILSYRTYRRPRYKVAYKMVTEMEWKCCHGYSGDNCQDGPQVTTNTQVSAGRPRVTQTGFNTGGGQRGEGRDDKRTRRLNKWMCWGSTCTKLKHSHDVHYLFLSERVGKEGIHLSDCSRSHMQNDNF